MASAHLDATYLQSLYWDFNGTFHLSKFDDFDHTAIDGEFLSPVSLPVVCFERRAAARDMYHDMSRGGGAGWGGALWLADRLRTPAWELRAAPGLRQATRCRIQFSSNRNGSDAIPT